jgi:hypothetical protein
MSDTSKTIIEVRDRSGEWGGAAFASEHVLTITIEGRLSDRNSVGREILKFLSERKDGKYPYCDIVTTDVETKATVVHEFKAGMRRGPVPF